VTRLARLLDAEKLRRYDGLALSVRRGMGDRIGERRFPGRPQQSGLEVEAYGSYTAGEDLRHLDWHALARLDALLVRRFTAEREVLVHILIDCSASMDVPEGDGKLETALALAMALGYLAVGSNDAVRVALLGAGGVTFSPTFRQRPSAVGLARFLQEARAAGTFALGDALERYARAHPRPGLAVVISDFMSEPVEIEPGVRALAARGYELHLLQVLAAGERDPSKHFSRGLLRDVESGASHPMVVTPGTRTRYQALLAAHLTALAELAARAGAGYARLATDEAVESFVAGELARLGLVRRR
jgi:uncharacterized protein (DUF58 family)